MKTLIILGSPRRDGDSAFLAKQLANELEGEIVWLSAYRDKLSPCVDCRHCSRSPECAISDDMQMIYNDDFDCVVFASPIYMSTLPGPVVSILSRFQTHFAARRFLGTKIEVTRKRCALILTGGGEGKPGDALRLSRLLLRNMGGELQERDIIMSLNTDALPACEDTSAIQKAREVGKRLADVNNYTNSDSSGIELQTDDLILREVTETDISEVARMWDFENGAISEDDAREAVTYMRQRHAQNTHGNIFHLCLAVFERDSHRIIGWCGLDGAMEADKLWIFFMIDAQFRGKGYATQCAKRLITYAFEEAGITKVDGGCERANIASYKIMEKSGMELCGFTDSGDPVLYIDAAMYSAAVQSP